jgi:hypothetical protein
LYSPRVRLPWGPRIEAAGHLCRARLTGDGMTRPPTFATITPPATVHIPLASSLRRRRRTVER